MVLYLSSREQLPVIQYDVEAPAFHTKELNESEKAVLWHFSLPFVLYIGSNEGCGCSFRHSLYNGGEWINVISEDFKENLATQTDHEALVNYLSKLKSRNFEIYSCWDGDFDLPAAFETEIKIEDILHPDFYFREQAYYWVNASTI